MSDTHKDLAEAMRNWDQEDPSEAADRASAAAEQAANMEHELERKARGNADLAISAVVEAIAADQGDTRKVLYSLLSEDYREGGSSDYNKNDYYIRHQNGKVAVTTFSGGIDRQDATFKLISPLCKPGEGSCPKQNGGSSGCVSIESVNWQRNYLVQHEAGELSFAEGDGSEGFKAAATFCLKPGLANEGSGVSIEPLGEPENYLLHEGYHMVIGKVQGPSAKGTQLEATFRLRPGLFMGFCQGPEKPTECTCLGGFLGDSCAQPCPGLEVQPDGMVEVCNNQGDCTLDKNKQAACVCHEGFLGKECNLLCPRSTKNSKLCHGRGECAVNEAFQPTCKCERGYLGNDCFLACPRDQVDNVCANHGECSAVGDNDTKCTCNPGWVGKACDLECPTNKAGDSCSNRGECVVKDYKAHCVCQGGFLGPACEAECPGVVKMEGEDAQTVGCNGHGDCIFDAETGTASCKCNVADGWLGEGCQKECKRGRDDQGNEDAVCSGHGKCDLGDDENPVCECDSLYTGESCGVNCPTQVAGKVCSGHGQCSLPESNDGPGTCNCEDDWMGDGCSLSCPKSKEGVTCSGHGKCAVQGIEAQCQCDTQWMNDDCGEHKCGTEAGFFDVNKDECKCPATSEKCCSRDVIAKAALLDKMLAERRKMLRSGAELKEESMSKMLDQAESEVMSLSE